MLATLEDIFPTEHGTYWSYDPSHYEVVRYSDPDYNLVITQNEKGTVIGVSIQAGKERFSIEKYPNSNVFCPRVYVIEEIGLIDDEESANKQAVYAEVDFKGLTTADQKVMLIIMRRIAGRRYTKMPEDMKRYWRRALALIHRVGLEPVFAMQCPLCQRFYRVPRGSEIEGMMVANLIYRVGDNIPVTWDKCPYCAKNYNRKNLYLQLLKN